MSNQQPAANFGSVAKQSREQELLSSIVKRKDKFLAVLPDFVSDNRERYFEMCLIALRNPKIAECEPTSVITSMLRSAQWGLLADGVHGALVPYRVQGTPTCTFLPMVKGLIATARRSGEIKQVWADNVIKGDRFHVEKGDSPKLSHSPNYEDGPDRTNRENIRLAYAAARWTNGYVSFDVLTLDEIAKAQRVSKAKADEAPWNQWFERMTLKTALKRLCGTLPMSSESHLLLAASDHEAGYVVDVEGKAAGRKSGSEAVALLNTGEKARDFIAENWSDDLARPTPAQEPVPVTQAVRDTQAKRALTPEEQRLQDKDKQ